MLPETTPRPNHHETAHWLSSSTGIVTMHMGLSISVIVTNLTQFLCQALPYIRSYFLKKPATFFVCLSAYLFTYFCCISCWIEALWRFVSPGSMSISQLPSMQGNSTLDSSLLSILPNIVGNIHNPRPPPKKKCWTTNMTLHAIWSCEDHMRISEA